MAYTVRGIGRLTTPIKIGDTQVDILTEAGPTRGTSASSYNFHTHTAHEVYLMEAGTMTLECGGEILSLSMGDLMVIRANVPHRIISYSSDFARFTLSFLLDSREFTDRILKNYLHFVPTQREKGEILDAARHLRELASKELDKYEFFRFKAYYGIIFSFILGPFCINDKEQQTECYSKLTQYSKIEVFFQKNFDKQITLDDLASYLSYSKAQTNRILRECKGGTFSQVLRNTRIEHAKTLLTTTKLPISEISVKCGYDTRQGFELMFGKSTGMTPHAYRDKYSK